MTFKEINTLLEDYVKRVKTYSGDNLTLDRMWPMLEALGNPQAKLRAIHIAGTSGKTSTAYYCSALLSSAGFRVGLTVSPHIDSILERIQINGVAISVAEFEKQFTTFYSLIKNLTVQPSYFELLVAFELWYFAEIKVDYAVVETGMGGMLDATNVLRRSDKVCVITDIGYDHMHILGNTLPLIARQKAGIIHTGNDVFIYDQEAEIMSEVGRRVGETKSTLHLVEEAYHKDKSLHYLPHYQKRNYFLAARAASYILERDGFSLQTSAYGTVIPARMEEWILYDDTKVVMDGAHNKQKMQAFVDSFSRMYKQKVPVLFALKTGKEYPAVVDELLRVASHCIITTFTTSQDLPAVSQDPYVIQSYAVSVGLPAIVVEDHTQALRMLIEEPATVKVITGSFYLIGQIRPMLVSK